MKVIVFLAAVLVGVALGGIGAQHGVTVFEASDKRLVILAVDSNRFVQLSVQIVNSEDRFSAWQNLGSVSTSNAAGGFLSNGGLVVFARNERNDITFKHAMTDKTWSIWKTLQAPVRMMLEPAVVKGPDGKLEVYGLGVDEHLWLCKETGTGDATSFSAWEMVSHHQVLGLPTFAVNNKGARVMYVRGGDNFVYEAEQGPSGWSRLRTDSALRILGDPVVASNADGRLEVFCRGADNQVYHKWQKVVRSTGDWSEWTSIKGVTTANPAVAATWDKRLEVFARGSDNAIWSNEFDWDEGWGYWGSLGGKFVGSPKVASYTDGRIILFAVARDATIWFRSQSAIPKADFLPWKKLGGDVFA